MRKAMRLAIPVLLLCGVAAAAGPYYLLTYTVTPGVKVTALTPEQRQVFMAHGQQIGQLQQSGSMYMAGHTTNPENVTAVGIVNAKDEAAARAIADGDPAVKAGLLKVTVEPFDLLFPPLAPALVKDSKSTYDLITRFVLEAARKMPEEQYGFRPTTEVRTFGQILGHIAEAQYIGCGSVRGETYTPARFREDQDGEGGTHRDAGDGVRVLPGGLGEDDGRGGRGPGAVLRAAARQADGAGYGDIARVRALRESGDVHAAEGVGASEHREQGHSVGENL